MYGTCDEEGGGEGKYVSHVPSSSFAIKTIITQDEIFILTDMNEHAAGLAYSDIVVNVRGVYIYNR